MLHSKVRMLFLSGLALSGFLAGFVMLTAQTAKRPIVKFTATTDNVGVPGQSIQIELLAWSPDAERDLLVKAWTTVPELPPVIASSGADQPPSAAPAAAAGARGNRGGNRGGGAAPAPGQPPQAATGAAAGARGNRGGNRGGGEPAPPPVPVTPDSSLAAALQRAPTVGVLWTSESAGYSIRYAYRLVQSDGSERIILATDRRLGAWNAAWKPVGTLAPADYRFSVIELRVNARGQGEGKVSLSGPITVDTSAKSIALENYSGLPVVLKNVSRQN
jgi:hypothetical protein